jgi:hypothetical protein
MHRSFTTAHKRPLTRRSAPQVDWLDNGSGLINHRHNFCALNIAEVDYRDRSIIRRVCNPAAFFLRPARRNDYYADGPTPKQHEQQRTRPQKFLSGPPHPRYSPHPAFCELPREFGLVNRGRSAAMTRPSLGKRRSFLRQAPPGYATRSPVALLGGIFSGQVLSM